MVAARSAGFSLWLLAAGIIGAALAGPAVERRTAETFRNLDGLAILVDTSRSMTDGGGSGDARLAAMQVLEAAGSRQAMLVLYAGDAYAAAAFTGDREVLRPLIMGETAGVVPDTGSNPTRALVLARRAFAQADMLGGDLVVVTDGGGIDQASLAQASVLRAEGRHVHVIYAPAPPPVGLRATARPQRRGRPRPRRRRAACHRQRCLASGRRHPRKPRPPDRAGGLRRPRLDRLWSLRAHPRHACTAADVPEAGMMREVGHRGVHDRGVRRHRSRRSRRRRSWRAAAAALGHAVIGSIGAAGSGMARHRALSGRPTAGSAGCAACDP